MGGVGDVRESRGRVKATGCIRYVVFVAVTVTVFMSVLVGVNMSLGVRHHGSEFVAVNVGVFVKVSVLAVSVRAYSADRIGLGIERGCGRGIRRRIRCRIGRGRGIHGIDSGYLWRCLRVWVG